jgi:hypothetical protein
MNEDYDKRWLLIDDKHVEYFNIENLPDIAFGESKNGGDDDNDDDDDDQSAYLLLYQKTTTKS